MSAGSAIGRDIPPFRGIIEELRCGKVVPFLGAGASGLRAAGALPPLPSGAELARRIALDAEFPVEDDRDLKDLPKVASYYVDKINRDALRRTFGGSSPSHSRNSTTFIVCWQKLPTITCLLLQRTMTRCSKTRFGA
jgi:hypothetical protein